MTLLSQPNPPDDAIALTVGQLRQFADFSKQQGTQDVMIDILLDCLDQANKEIQLLTAMLNE